MLIVVAVGLIMGIAGQMVSLIPRIPVPGWLESAVPGLTSALGAASSMGVWIPLGLAGSVAGLLLACALGGGVIKLARIVASFLTAGGGSAA